MSQKDWSIERVDVESANVLAHLFEFYLHDMAEWFRFDTQADGSYGYDLTRHFERGDRIYLARVGAAPAGFALVGRAPEWLDDPTANDVEEFFVVRRHRHSGLADALARTIWDAEPGRWRVRVFEGNVPAIPFWRRIVAAYSGNRYTEERHVNNSKNWIVFGFANAHTSSANT